MGSQFADYRTPASNAIQTTFRQRYHNATGTGPLTSPGGAQPVARVTYVAMYPDAVGRQQAQANYGTNGDVTLVSSSTIPASADTVLVTTTVYNPRGEAYQTIDPAGRLDQTTFDDAGRRVELVLNVQPSSSSSSASSSSSGHTAGLPISDDQNNTTLWTYTADSQIATLTAVNAATGDQTTMYLYGTSLPGSDVARNDVLASVIYPDGGIVTYLVNGQSQVKQFTDQRLVVHAYSFDLLGRQTQDAVISLGSSSSGSSSGSSSSPSSSSGSGDTSGVDGTVQRIGRTYEVRGLLENVTSYSSPNVGEGSVVNDVQRVYNSFEQLVTEYQEHSGAVNTSTSVNVQYQYADGSSNTVRATQAIYPDGRQVHRSYGLPGGVDDALSRIASLIDNDGVTHLADYTRIGRDTFVEQSSPEPQIAWSLINGSGIDPYTGLDQFNRVVDNRWYSTANGTDLDRIQHGYDRASNRAWRENTVAEATGVYLDELYSYDGLYRLAQLQRGQLNGTDTAILAGTLTFAQAWGLDATGNWQRFWNDESGSSWDLQQTRAGSKFNEISAIIGGAWAQPAYDAAGNMVQMPQQPEADIANGAAYDSWNRLTRVASGGSTVQRCVYDGTSRRVTALTSDVLRHFYYSPGWRSLEERVGTSTSADRQFVWGVRYQDDLLLRDRGTERLYGFNDANHNLTALCDQSGVVRERYSFSAYGSPAFLDAQFNVISMSQYAWETLFAGYRFDASTGLTNARNRYLHHLLGCWLTSDPLVYDSGDLNLFRYVGNVPVRYVDPFGTECSVTWGDVFNHAKQAGDANGDCVTMNYVDYAAYLNAQPGCKISPAGEYRYGFGCIGLCSIAQDCGRVRQKDFVDPIDRATSCFQDPKDAEKFTCAQGTKKFTFIFEGFWVGGVRPGEKSGLPLCGQIAGDKSAAPGSRFNYIAMVGGYCISMNHGRLVPGRPGADPNVPPIDEDPDDRQTLTICRSKANCQTEGTFKARVWAVTCRGCS